MFFCVYVLCFKVFSLSLSLSSVFVVLSGLTRDEGEQNMGMILHARRPKKKGNTKNNQYDGDDDKTFIIIN